MYDNYYFGFILSPIKTFTNWSVHRIPAFIVLCKEMQRKGCFVCPGTFLVVEGLISVFYHCKEYGRG